MDTAKDLAAACRAVNVTAIKSIINNCEDVSSLISSPPDRIPYIVIVCICEKSPDVVVEAAEILLSHGCLINDTTMEGISPLMAASFTGNAELVEFLLNHGADCCLRDNRGDNSLHILLRNILNTENRKQDINMTVGQRRVFQLLLSAGCDVNDRDRHGSTLLRYCCLFDLLEGAEMLVAAGADVNIMDQIGFSPLMICAKLGRVKIMRLLLAHSADMHVVYSSTLDAMALACRLGKVEIADILLEHGYDPNVVMANGSLPIIEALYFRHTDIVKVLINRGADVNGCTTRGLYVPLVAASFTGCLHAVQLLIAHGADTSTQSDQGFTALMGAACMGHLDILNYLLDFPGCEIDAIGHRNGQSALMVACQRDPGDDTDAVVELLLRRKAAINTQSFTGCSPLMIAASNSNLSAVSLLLQHNADTELMDTKGRRAIDWTNSDAVRTLLLKVGWSAAYTQTYFE